MNFKKYITNITGLQFFQLLRFSMLLLISIVFTKTNLGTGEIGIYETFLLIAGGVSFFWISGIIQSFLSLFNRSDSLGNSLHKKTPALFNTVLLLFVFSALAALFVYVSRSFLAQLLNLTGGNIPYLKILLMYIVISGPVNIIEYIFLLRNQSGWIIKYGLISLTLQFICVTTPVLLGFDLGYGLYGLVFVNIIRFVWMGFLVLKYSKISISLSYIKEQLWVGSPLILSLLLSGSAQYIDGFLVSNFFNEASFAVFRYGARELPFVTLLANAFSNAMIPVFADKGQLSSGLVQLRQKGLKLMHVLFPVSIVFLLLSNWLYPIVFNQSFAESASVFNVYLLIIVSRLVFPQTILIGQQKSGVIMSVSLIEIIVNVFFSILLIRHLGIVGVAYATIIAYFLEKLLLVIYLRVKMNIPMSQYTSIRWFTLYTVAILITYAMVTFVIR